MANAIAVLSRYEEAVVAEACGPGVGLQTRSKWLPTVSEIREACEQSLQAKVDRDRRARLAQHRVLIDTHHGPMPEPEAAKLSEDERRRIIAGFGGLQADLRPVRKREPPNMDLLKPRPVAPLSALAKNAFGISPQEAAE